MMHSASFSIARQLLEWHLYKYTAPHFYSVRNRALLGGSFGIKCQSGSNVVQMFKKSGMPLYKRLRGIRLRSVPSYFRRMASWSPQPPMIRRSSSGTRRREQYDVRSRDI